jgi:hypothetical protein
MLITVKLQEKFQMFEGYDQSQQVLGSKIYRFVLREVLYEDALVKFQLSHRVISHEDNNLGMIHRKLTQIYCR